MTELINELSEINYLQENEHLGKLFPKGVYLDMSKLTVNGHSFGAITSILAGAQDKRVKASLSLDPWFFPISRPEAWISWTWRKAGNKPLQSLRTDTFNETQRKEFPKVDEMCKEYFESAHESSGGLVEHVRLINTGHFD